MARTTAILRRRPTPSATSVPLPLPMPCTSTPRRRPSRPSPGPTITLILFRETLLTAAPPTTRHRPSPAQPRRTAPSASTTVPPLSARSPLTAVAVGATPLPPLSNGSNHSYTATTTDAAGNTSAASAAYALHIDTLRRHPQSSPGPTITLIQFRETLLSAAPPMTRHRPSPAQPRRTAPSDSTTVAPLLLRSLADGSGSWSYTPAPLSDRHDPQLYGHGD